MVKPMLRTRTKKRVRKRTPGGRLVTHFKAKKPGKKTCSRCSVKLAGTPSLSISGIRKLGKTEKKPTRAYSGVLCPKCLEYLIGYKTRFEVKYDYPDFSEIELTRDLTLEKYLPKGWYKSISKA